MSVDSINAEQLRQLSETLMRQTGETDPSEAFRLIISGKWIISRPRGSTYRQNALVCFSVTTVDDLTSEMVIVKGKLFCTNKRMIKKIRTEAYSGSLTNGQKLRAPGMEEARLVLKKFTCEQIKDMGLLLLVVMHTPITMSYRTGEYLFTSSCQPQIGKEETFCPDDAVWRNPNIGFVFAVA